MLCFHLIAMIGLNYTHETNYCATNTLRFFCLVFFYSFSAVSSQSIRPMHQLERIQKCRNAIQVDTADIK